MKKLIILLILSGVFRISDAQWINSISYQPANPTTLDTITFYASLSFPSGNCDYYTQGHTLNGNTIDAWALHCIGMLTYICNHTDTFKVNPLPSGAYTFRLQLDAGSLPFPCTPGIIPTNADSISFIVSPTSSVPLSEIPAVSASVSIDGNQLLFSGLKHENNCNIEIFSADGRSILIHELQPGNNALSVFHLAPGVYFYQLSLNDKREITKGKFIKKSR